MKKYTCSAAVLCVALMLFAQTEPAASGQQPVYQTLLQYRIEHDSKHRQLQMQAEIAANKAEKAKTESLVTTEVGSGDTQLTLNGDTAQTGIKTAPYASVLLPSYNNTGVKVRIPYNKEGRTITNPSTGSAAVMQTQNLGAEVTVSTDIYSKNAEKQKYTRGLAQSAAKQARKAEEEGISLAEKQFLQDIQKLLDDYTTLLDKELNEVKAEIQYNQTKTQGYAETSTKMRTADLELLSAKREHQNADFSFSASYRVFAESCGIAPEENPRAFLTTLWDSIPIQKAADIEQYPLTAYKTLVEAEQRHLQNTVKRDIELSPFALGAEAGYLLRNTQTTLSGASTKERAHAVLGGLTMQFPGGKAYTGVEIPLSDPKSTAFKLAFSWNPFSIRYRKLDKHNAELEHAIEMLKIEDAKEQYRKQLQSHKISSEQMTWQQTATADELSIYKQNAEDHAQWYRSGIINRFENLRAELEYKKAEARHAKAKTAVIIFNIDTALLFEKQ